MRQLIALTRVILKSSTDVFFQPQKRKKLKRNPIVSKILMVVLFLYLGSISYFVWNGLIKSFVSLAQPTFAIYLFNLSITLYTFFIAILTIPSIFYFSKDVDRFLVLPINPRTIIAAKTISTVITMVAMSLFLIIPFSIAYFVNVRPDFLFLIRFLVGTFTIPLLPTIIALVFMIILLTIIPFIKNKDIFTYISSILAIAFGIGINFVVQSNLVESNLENIILALQNGNNSLMRIMSTIFPSLNMINNGIAYGDFLSLLGGIFINILIAIISIFAVQNLYFRGVIGIEEVHASKKRLSLADLNRYNKHTSAENALIRYDWRNILRTPAFVTNYFVGFIILPVLVIVPIVVKNGIQILSIRTEGIQVVQSILSQIDIPTVSLGTFTTAALTSLFMTNVGMISATSISREGTSWLQFRTMPLDLFEVIKAKIKLASRIILVPTLIFIISLSLFLRLPLYLLLIAISGSIFGSYFGNTIAIILDIYSPKLIWDNESQAIKQNFMATIPLLTVFFVIAMFVISIFKVGMMKTALIFIIGLILLFFLVIFIIKRNAIKHLEAIIERI